MKRNNTPESSIIGFKFPSWEEFRERNRCFQERKEYKGYSVQIHVADNLYLLIDCQNDSAVFPNSEDVIRFAWCTQNGFAISSVKYKFCEGGYLSGCVDLFKAANTFRKCFSAFVEEQTNPLFIATTNYRNKHPEEIEDDNNG